MQGYDEDYNPMVSFIDKILTIVGQYLIWIALIGIIIINIYVPIDFEDIVAGTIFWGPVVIFFLGLLLITAKNAFRFRRDKEREKSQYEVIIEQPDIYLVDLIIYGGAIAFLAIPYFIDYFGGIDVIDLVQAVVFFALAGVIKKSLLKKY